MPWIFFIPSTTGEKNTFDLKEWANQNRDKVREKLNWGNNLFEICFDKEKWIWKKWKHGKRCFKYLCYPKNWNLPVFVAVLSGTKVLDHTEKTAQENYDYFVALSIIKKYLKISEKQGVYTPITQWIWYDKGKLFGARTEFKNVFYAVLKNKWHKTLLDLRTARLFRLYLENVEYYARHGKSKTKWFKKLLKSGEKG